MAKCDEGYFCGVCNRDVANIAQSDLYLRYVIGLVDPEVLHTMSERHILCNPNLAQFIVAEEFEPVDVEGEWSKSNLDPDYVAKREALVTRGWRRLQELRGVDGVSILDFPLPEVVESLQKRAAGPKETTE